MGKENAAAILNSRLKGNEGIDRIIQTDAMHFKNTQRVKNDPWRASETSRKHQSTTVFLALRRMITVSERPATALFPLNVVINI